MGGASRSIFFDVIGRDQASTTFDKVGSSAQRAEGKLSKVGSALKTAAKVGILATAGAAVAGAKALYDMAQGAAEDQAAAGRLAKTLQNTAHATRGQIAATEEWITKQGIAYGVADDQLRPALGKLAVATHSVAKSQRLASLAMDVSAGTGKSLETVSAALAKAYLGQMGGLSRLGIQTKDAKGKTISFAAAQRELSKSFGGQAAKYADTYSGRLQKMKVALSETGESIGYAVLPMMTRLSTWVASKGVPKLQQLQDWLAKNKSQFQQVGETVKSTLLPPLKTAGGLVQSAAKFFGGLPGPLKSVGIEAGIAALVMPRLTAGVTSVTTAVGFNIARMRQFRAELSYTETRGAAVSTMLGKLGGAARLAAGIGGMLAITQASKTADRSLKDMENAAGMAATGFAVGGPWGAAIGGGIGLVQGLVHSIKDSTSATRINYGAIGKTASLDVAKQAYGDLRSTLDETTGAYTKNTRAAIENWLQTTDAGKKVRAQLAGRGVNDRTIIESVLGNPAAIARTSTAFKASLSSVNAQIRTVAAQMKGMSAVDLASTDQGKALLAQAAALTKQKTELVANRGAFTGYVGTLKQAARDQRNFHDATEPVLKLLHLTKKAYDTTFSKRARGELTLDGVPKTLDGIKLVAKRVGGLTKPEWKVLLKTAGVDTTTKQFNNLVKVGTDTGKKTGDHWWQNVSSSIAGGQPKTTSAMKTLLSGAGNGSSRTAALVGRSGALTITNSMASQIRAGRGPVVASMQYLMNELRRSAGGSGGGGGGGGSASTPHGAQRTVGRGMVGSLRAAVNASTFKGIGKSAVSAFLQGFDDDSQNRADRVADKLRDAISKAIRSKKNKDGISKAAADTMRDAVNAMMKQADAMRDQLSKRLNFKKGLLSSFKGELDLGSMIGEDGTLTSGMLQGGITALATRLRNFAGQLGDLAKAHFPKGLISEVANLGSDQGSTVATALLSSSGSGRGDLISAYNSYSSAANSAATAGANAYYGTAKQIRNEYHFHFDGRVLATKSDIGKEVFDALREYQRQTGNRVVAGP